MGSTARAQDAPPRQPNIVILYADDLGLGDLGCHNAESKIPTPNLDKLAASGARFTDGHSSSGICTPSRYALLTGRHHWRDFHGIVNAFGRSVFQPEQLTLPEMLQQQGYATACIGKWHLGFDWDAIRIKKGNRFDAFDWSKPIPDGPLAHGFDHYFGDAVINFPPYAWIEDDKVTQVPDRMMDTKAWPEIKEGGWECRGGPMVAGWNPYEVLPTLGDRAVAYVESRKDKDEPFFLYFAFPSPHAPIIPNDTFDGKSEAGPYGDFVVETDHVAGRILDALDSAGLADNTIVIFSADNGPEHYAYPRDEAFGHWSSQPLRGLKRDIYEGGHRVPFIVRWPGLTKAGEVKEALVSQIDIFATLAEALGAELPDDAAVDSHTMLGFLKGEADVVRTHHIHNTFKTAWAIRDGDWLLIDAKSGTHSRRGSQEWAQRHDYPPDDEEPVELYHLKDDLGQRHNLAAEHPDKVEAMQALLQKLRDDGRSRPATVPDLPAEPAPTVRQLLEVREADFAQRVDARDNLFNIVALATTPPERRNADFAKRAVQWKIQDVPPYYLSWARFGKEALEDADSAEKQHKLLVSGEAAPKDVPAVKLWLDKFGPALTALEQFAVVSHARIPVDTQVTTLRSFLDVRSHVLEFSELVVSFQIRGFYALASGDLESAVISAIAADRVIKLMLQLRHGEALSLATTRAWTNRELLAAVLASDRLTAEQLERLAEQWDKPHRAMSPAERVDQWERLWLIDYLERVESGDEEAPTFLATTWFAMSGPWGKEQLETWDWMLAHELFDTDHAIQHIHNRYDRLVGTLSIDESANDAFERLQRTGEEVQRRFQLGKLNWVIHNKAIPPGYDSPAYTEHVVDGMLYLFMHPDRTLEGPIDTYTFQTQQELARTMIALTQYRQAKGVFPDTLDDLAPAYLDKVPTDPWKPDSPVGYQFHTNEDTAHVRVHSMGTYLTDEFAYLTDPRLSMSLKMPSKVAED